MNLSKSIKWFSLVELLVVITILAIISVVAYTNFGGSTDKAKNSKRLSDVTSIETALQTFYQEKNYYPMPSSSWSDNVWWYSSWASEWARASNTFNSIKNWNQIDSITQAYWWWIVYNTNHKNIIWAKWVMDSNVLGKQYLSQELFDPALKDVKVWTGTFKDYWIGKYVYWVYAKPVTSSIVTTPTEISSWNTNGIKWQAYNIAITLTDEQKTYVTKIIWNFDKNTCTCIFCPDTLIWNGFDTIGYVLKDWDAWTWSWTDSEKQWIPYPIEGF